MSQEDLTVGGAQRAERKRKQQAAQTAAQATPVPVQQDRGGRRSVVGVTVVVLLALLVGGGIWLSRRGADLPPAIPVAAPGPVYPVAAQGDTVVIGKPAAPVTIDVYEDFLCSGCGQLEQLYGRQLEAAAAAGQARVTYHPVAILDEYSEPEGYSTLAAGSALCAAEAGIFPRFHDSLYDTQPLGSGPAWSTAQLQQLGGALGAGPDFARCVATDHDERITRVTDQARQQLSDRRPDGRFGTPTVLVNGAIADTSDPGWLDEALGAAR